MPLFSIDVHGKSNHGMHVALGAGHAFLPPSIEVATELKGLTVALETEATGASTTVSPCSRWCDEDSSGSICFWE